MYSSAHCTACTIHTINKTGFKKSAIKWGCKSEPQYSEGLFYYGVAAGNHYVLAKANTKQQLANTGKWIKVTKQSPFSITMLKSLCSRSGHLIFWNVLKLDNEWDVCDGERIIKMEPANRIPLGLSVRALTPSFPFSNHKLIVLLHSGATPQRREFVYPRQLHKARSRSELLSSVRRQQEDLQALLKEEEEQREEDDKQSQTGTVRTLYFPASASLENLIKHFQQFCFTFSVIC